MPGRKASEEERREQLLDAAYEVACRAGIEGVTLRAVAAEARLSHALVLFHFKRKDNLVGALLDRVLATTAILEMREDVAALPRAADRLQALLGREVDRLAREPQQMRLFLEYWALGARDAAIRTKVSAALERYRQAFRALTTEVLHSAPGRVRGVTPDGLAAVAVSLINGGAAQAMLDPDGFDVASYLAAGHSLIERLAATAA